MTNNGWYAVKLSQLIKQTKTEQLSVLYQRAQKAVEDEGDGDTNRIWSIRNILNEYGEKADDLEVRGRIEIIHLKSARILWRVSEIWGDLLPLRLQWKDGVKKIRKE